MFYPLARVAAVYGPPVDIPPDLTPEGLEAARRKMEDLYVAFDAEVDAYFEPKIRA